MKSQLAIVTACAAVIAGMIGTPAARAGADPARQGRYYAPGHRRPVPERITGNTTYWCKFRANAPFWLTSESSQLYSTGTIFQCSTPIPTGCHMTVELEELMEIGGVYRWQVIASGDRGWIACATKGRYNTTTTSYKCQSVLHDRSFQTVVTLAIDFPGGTGTGSPAVSSSVIKACE